MISAVRGGAFDLLRRFGMHATIFGNLGSIMLGILPSYCLRTPFRRFTQRTSAFSGSLLLADIEVETLSAEHSLKQPS